MHVHGASSISRPYSDVHCNHMLRECETTYPARAGLIKRQLKCSRACLSEVSGRRVNWMCDELLLVPVRPQPLQLICQVWTSWGDMVPKRR